MVYAHDFENGRRAYVLMVFCDSIGFETKAEEDPSSLCLSQFYRIRYSTKSLTLLPNWKTKVEKSTLNRKKAFNEKYLHGWNVASFASHISWTTLLMVVATLLAQKLITVRGFFKIHHSIVLVVDPLKTSLWT